MLGAFVVTFGVAFREQTRQAEQNAAALIRIKIRDTRNQLQVNAHNVAALYSLTNSAALAKARAFAEMLRLVPTLRHDQSRLNDIRLALDVNELNVCDADGVIIASTDRDVMDYDMKSSAQSRVFMPAISSPGFALVQEPTPRGVDGRLYQYAASVVLTRPTSCRSGIFPNACK